jgi:hypothetical protein
MSITGLYQTNRSLKLEQSRQKGISTPYHTVQFFGPCDSRDDKLVGDYSPPFLLCKSAPLREHATKAPPASAAKEVRSAQSSGFFGLDMVEECILSPAAFLNIDSDRPRLWR